MKTYGYIALLAAALSSIAQAAPAEKRQVAPIQVVYPNYIIPIKQNAPDTAFGPQFRGDIYYHSFAARNETRLLLGFDMPSNAATNCQLAFNLPPAGTPNAFPWSQSGNPTLWVYTLSRIVDVTDTWNKRPARVPEARVGTIILRSEQFPDASQSLIQGIIPCKKGQRLDLELAYRAQGGEGNVNWFEMSDPRTGITVEMFNYGA
ncbi:hypothetical protein BJ508DRAFT_320297 [Ascobolus immersus RN42]|uniref:Ubiquitin 3 binding protein But2 C-terminal domain-containing protein n=1 Tax=Ascobolus immersus RN42 TaxID=1160509 RepID=A0A3N4ITY1_ASCIM|nr:hypothetical protein BJ508DRAFT_320297 [Ascobolus immersus RN42]